jgi:hypothetical protein
VVTLSPFPGGGHEAIATAVTGQTDQSDLLLLNLFRQSSFEAIMNQGNGGNQGNRGYEGNSYGHNQGQQYPSSSNMQYNYTMNQPYAANMANMGYQEQYYPQQEQYGAYGEETYEEADYDNLDEIDRVSFSQCANTASYECCQVYFKFLTHIAPGVSRYRSSTEALRTTTRRR